MDKKCYQIKIFSHNFPMNLELFCHFSTGSQKELVNKYIMGIFWRPRPSCLVQWPFWEERGVGYTPSWKFILHNIIWHYFMLVKLFIYMTYDLAIPLPKICPREILLHMQISSKIFREALLAADNTTCRGIKSIRWRKDK